MVRIVLIFVLVELYPNFNFNYPGKHNLSNALAALIIAFKLNCKIEDLKPALHSFKGVQRRYSFILIIKI